MLAGKEIKNGIDKKILDELSAKATVDQGTVLCSVLN